MIILEIPGPFGPLISSTYDELCSLRSPQPNLLRGLASKSANHVTQRTALYIYRTLSVPPSKYILRLSVPPKVYTKVIRPPKVYTKVVRPPLKYVLRLSVPPLSIY